MEKQGIKLDINDKDLALVCLAVENEELKRNLSTDSKIFRSLKNKNTILGGIAIVSMYMAYTTYRELEKAKFIINNLENDKKKKTDEA